MIRVKSKRICEEGHSYIKSSDCLICPVCEQEYKANADFLSLISAPARRALEGKGIMTLEQLSEFSEDELLKIHGFGPSSIPKLRKALREKELDYRKP